MHQNLQLAQTLGISMPGGEPYSFSTVAQTLGAARQAQVGAASQGGALGNGEQPLPATQAGAPGNAGIQGPTAQSNATPVAPGQQPGGITAGTLMRNGDVSNQLLQTTQVR
jgi:hypothetical protein